VTESALVLDGRRWAYLEEGDGPLLLLFHGTLSYKESFRPQLAALSRRRRVVAFDWPGHGGSDFDPRRLTVADLVAAVPRLIEALGAERAALGGVSQGGAISMRVALEDPGRVEALITMSAGFDPVGPRALAALAALGRTLAEGSDDERRKALVAHQERFLHAPGWLDAHPAEAAEELDRMLAHPREAAVAVTQVPAGYESIEGRAAQIGCPTLVIWGEDDARSSRGPAMAESIPGARLEMLQGAGHHVTLDAPAEVSGAIEEFLGNLN
jgi:pimeloyl-ACP methyl ester carboxylesterase